MKNLIIALLVVLAFSNCTKEVIKEVEKEVEKEEPFYDEDLIKNGWRLDAFLDANGDTLLAKPTDLPQDIYLVFTKDKRVVGHVASWKLDEGVYTIDNNKSLTMQFSRHLLMTCCDWDDLFLSNFRDITKYEVVTDYSLTLYYGSTNNKMIFIIN